MGTRPCLRHRKKSTILLWTLTTIVVYFYQYRQRILFRGIGYLNSETDHRRASQKNFAICRLQPHPHFDHFPHTAEQLFRCWSFFQNWLEYTCIIQLARDQIPPPGSWNRGLIQGMKCPLISWNDSSYDKSKHQRINHTVYHQTTFYIDKEGQHRTNSSWFSKGAADAIALQQHLGYPIKQVQRKNLHLALIQRRANHQRPGGDRILLNLPELHQEVQKRFPSIIISYNTSMEDLTFQQQVHFWNRHDIIILVHGAAATNVAFMRPYQSALVEVFPYGYKEAMFEELAKNIHVDYAAYRGSLNESVEGSTPSPIPSGRGFRRNKDIHVNVTALMALIDPLIFDMQEQRRMGMHLTIRE